MTFAEASKASGRLLVIDDDPAGRRLLEEIFQQQQFEVCTAADAKSGLALAVLVLAGVALAALAVPQGMAYAELAGLPVPDRVDGRSLAQIADKATPLRWPARCGAAIPIGSSSVAPASGCVRRASAP